MPCVRSARSANGRMLLPAAIAVTLSTSRPAQKAGPSPESTTARKLRSSLSRAPASAIARNIAGSRAFILSARLSRTSAMPSAIVSRMRSSMGPSPFFCYSERGERGCTAPRGQNSAGSIQDKAWRALSRQVNGPRRPSGRKNWRSRKATGKPRSRSIAITRSQTPDASGVPREHCRTQSERLRRDTANPQLHAFDVDLNESCVRAVRLVGKIGAVGVLPKPADLGSGLDQRGPAAQHNESIVLVALKDDSDLAGTTDVGCLARTAVGNEADGPVILFGGGQQTPHWPRIGTAGFGFGHQPAIAHAGDSLCSACEEQAYIIAPDFRLWHRQNLDEHTSTMRAFSPRLVRWLANGGQAQSR